MKKIINLTIITITTLLFSGCFNSIDGTYECSVSKDPKKILLKLDGDNWDLNMENKWMSKEMNKGLEKVLKEDPSAKVDFFIENNKDSGVYSLYVNAVKNKKEESKVLSTFTLNENKQIELTMGLFTVPCSKIK
ncbi:MAG: hypothetical protein GQ570_06965 [Helicobacteraceae bacterium]|nr:hypothetical protein [Helicobacteraceae bacterium]